MLNPNAQKNEIQVTFKQHANLKTAHTCVSLCMSYTVLIIYTLLTLIITAEMLFIGGEGLVHFQTCCRPPLIHVHVSSLSATLAGL